MIRTLALIAALALVACGKRQESPRSEQAPTHDVAQDPFTELEALEAKLYRDELTANSDRCPEACVLATRICELSARICALSATDPKCTDAGARCTKAQKHVTDRCTCSDEVH